MNTYLAIGGAALLLLAIIGGLIWAVVRGAKAQQKAEDQIKDQAIAKKQAEVVAEHRDPDRVTDRLRDGSF